MSSHCCGRMRASGDSLRGGQTSTIRFDFTATHRTTCIHMVFFITMIACVTTCTSVSILFPQSLECCARCEASLRRAIKSAPADTRDDDVGEEGGTRRAAAAVDAEAAANSAQPSADSGEGSFQANRYPSAKRTLKRWRDLLPTQQQGATKGTIRNLVLGLLKVQENKETANEGKERMVRFTAVTVPSHFAPTSVGRLSTGQNRDGADGVHYETGEG